MARLNDIANSRHGVSLALTRGFDSLLIALSIVGSYGCAELDPQDDIVCESEGNCTAAQPVSQVSQQWACLDKTPPVLPAPRPPTQPVGFVIPVLEWGTLASLAGQGLTAAYCTNTDFSCKTPLTQYTTRAGYIGDQPLPPEAAGAAGLPIFEGFDGFIKFTVTLPTGSPASAEYVPVTYGLGGRVSGDVTQGPLVLMLDRGTLANVLGQSFPNVDLTAAAGLGVVVVGAFDCNGAPVNNARIEINKTGVIPFVLPASRIPIAQSPDEPLFTGTAGLAGYLNVPLGAVQVSAFRGNDTVPVGVGQFGSVAGEISAFALRPPYLNDANVSLTTPAADD
jgi:hypothetical protein